ncbi:hypothetical protein VF21_00243 [Pseudogymnoascus sp. 05NY08]|nr:hypothetical protein VF21_00052 [Pseudogymnoascus sp. 05NY08]OBT80909.1 hypothetical protein VF21_00243 [Pseudogymnoascus sp. 05NY08]
MPENDGVGFWFMFYTLNQYQDFKKAAVALSLLGQPDLVTDALYFEAKDIVGNDGVNKERVLELVTNLAKEAIQAAKTQHPDVSQQIQRINAAREYVDNLAAAAETGPKPEADGGHGEEFQKEQGEQTSQDHETALAHRLLYNRLSNLQQVYAVKVDPDSFPVPLTCDGRTPDGKHCDKMADFKHELLPGMPQTPAISRLRRGHMVCNAKHRWLIIPPQGTDMYVGPRAKSVRMPKKVRAVKDDESILEICYGEDGDSEEITVEAWKETLAAEWGISLQGIREETSRQATPNEGEQEDKQEDKQEGRQEDEKEDKREDKQED